MEDDASFAAGEFVRRRIVARIDSEPHARERQIVRRLKLGIGHESHQSVGHRRAQKQAASAVNSVVTLGRVSHVHEVIRSLKRHVADQLRSEYVEKAAAPCHILRFAGIERLRSARKSGHLHIVAEYVVEIRISGSRSSVFDDYLSEVLTGGVAGLVIGIDRIIIPRSAVARLGQAVFDIVVRIVYLQRIRFACRSLLHAVQFAVIAVVSPHQQHVIRTGVQAFMKQRETRVVDLVNFFSRNCLAGRFGYFNQVLAAFTGQVGTLEESHVARFDIFTEYNGADRVFGSVSLRFELPRKLRTDAQHDGFVVAGLDVAE